MEGNNAGCTKSKNKVIEVQMCNSLNKQTVKH